MTRLDPSRFLRNPQKLLQQPPYTVDASTLPGQSEDSFEEGVRAAFGGLTDGWQLIRSTEGVAEWIIVRP